MELRFGIRTDFLDEVARIRELYESDVTHQVGEALHDLENQKGLDLFGAVYPIIQHRSMADGLPICIILQIVRGIIDEHIAACGRPCSQKWVLDSNGQIVAFLVEEESGVDVIPDPNEIVPPVKRFFDGVACDIQKENVGNGTSYLLNLIEILKDNFCCGADIYKGQLLIALIDQISNLTDQILFDIKSSHPSIGGSQDWYVNEDGNIIMELYLISNTTDIQ